jgi:hypothetical protein
MGNSLKVNESRSGRKHLPTRREQKSFATHLPIKYKAIYIQNDVDKKRRNCLLMIRKVR